MEPVQLFDPHSDLSNLVLDSRSPGFVVLKAHSAKYGVVALMTPTPNAFCHPDDPNDEAVRLLEQEFWVYNHLYQGPVPVPLPFRLLSIDGHPTMVSEYVENDRSIVADRELRRLAAMMHATTLPEGILPMVAQEEQGTLATIVERILQRFCQLADEIPDIPSWAPDRSILEPIAEQLERLDSHCLLHMDLRQINLRSFEHDIMAVTDWSSCMIGPNVVEIYHILELDEPCDEFLQEYTRLHILPEVTPEEEAFLRLDAALMLALTVATSMPHRECRESLERLKELVVIMSNQAQS